MNATTLSVRSSVALFASLASLLVASLSRAVPAIVAADPAPVSEGGTITCELLLTEPAGEDCEFLWQLVPIAGARPAVAHHDDGDLDPFPEIIGSASSPRGSRKGVVRVLPGGTAVQLSFSTRQDYWMEGTEKLRLQLWGGVNLTLPSNGPSLTLLDDDGSPVYAAARQEWKGAGTFPFSPPFSQYKSYFLTPMDAAVPAWQTIPDPWYKNVIEADFASLPDTWKSFDPLPENPTWCAVADIDRDGAPDVVTHQVTAGKFSVDGYLGGKTTATPGGTALPTRWYHMDVHEDATAPGTIACGDVDGDGYPEVVTGRGAGTVPTVTVSRMQSPQVMIAAWNVFDGVFPGGVNVAAADLDGDGRDEIITAAAPGGGPLVQWWRYTAAGPVLLGSVFIFDAGWRGGVAVSAGDTNGDGQNEIICIPNKSTFVNLVVYDPRSSTVIRNELLENPWSSSVPVPEKTFWVTGLTGRPGMGQNRILYGTPGQRRRVAHADHTVSLLPELSADAFINAPVWTGGEPHRDPQPAAAAPVVSLQSSSSRQAAWSVSGLVTGAEYDVETSTDLITWKRDRSIIPAASDPPFTISALFSVAPEKFWRIRATTPVAAIP